jgi:translocation and assembly module TamB
MTTHTQSSLPPRARAEARAKEPGRRRRRRRDWGRVLARVLCAVLALIGLVPFVATLVVRSAWARDWAARETQRLLRQQGVVASYAPSLRVWPLAVELDHLRLESSDGGAPVLECSRVALRPRLFALLAGKLAIDQVDLDGPHVRAVVRDGQLTNLALKPQEKSDKQEGPFHAPFNTFSVTDAAVDFTVDGVHLAAESIDLDVTADDDPALGSSFETTLRVGRASIERPRALADGSIASDDDTLCLVEGRVRVEPGAVLVRRFQAVASADLDPAPNTAPPCDLPVEDKRRVELSLGHLHVVFPKVAGGMPSVDGHVHARAPLGLAHRLVTLPETDGWVGVDLDVRYADDTILPDLSGTIEAHEISVDDYQLAHELSSEVTIRRNLIESPRTTLHFAGGVLVLSDTVVDPLSHGGRLQHTRLDASGVDFTALMRDLGVHPNSWVGWELREIHAPAISGTFSPLKIDGDFTAKTYAFGVYDRPAEERGRERLFGFSEAQIAAHFGVRPEALKFTDVHALLPHSRIDGGLCSIGFHNDLIVDVPHLEADLEDISPIGNVPMRGKLQASAHVDGVFNRPKPVGDITSLAGFSVADVSFGDLSAGHIEVDVVKPEVDITGVRAKRRESAYEVPTATLRFGGAQGFVVDAVGSSAGFGMRDVLSMFALDEDPRFDGLDATLAARADVHVSLGGPEDACGGGFISVATKGHLRNVSLYGERFAQGDAEATLRWYDREQGIAGADVDLRSFVLEKAQAPEGTRAGTSGTVLGSASIRRGGALAANVMLQGVPLSRVDSLGSLAPQVSGSVSGVAHVSGNLDDFLPDAGFVARAEVDVSAARVRGVAVQGSHLDLSMTDRMPQQKRSFGRTRCGAPIGPAFDAKAFLADTTSHGEWTLNGDLFGNSAHLHDVVLTRARSPHASGRVSFRGLDLGAVAGILGPRRTDADDASAPVAGAVGGQLWAELIVDDLPLDTPSKARGRLVLGPTFVTRGADKVTLSQLHDPIELADDALDVPSLEVTLETGEARSGAHAADGAADSGFHGGFVLKGGVSKISSDPTLAFDARLKTVDLAVLPRLVPNVDSVTGKLEGSLRVTGKVAAPTIAGELHAKADNLMVHGLPGAVTNIRIDVRASASEVAASGAGELAGGTVSFDGSIPIRGFAVGALDSRITVRGVHVDRADGVKAMCDADLHATYDPKTREGAAGAIPHLTGDVTIDSLAYTRPITMSANLPSFGTRAKRTEVNAYDPALDAIALDLRVRSAAPFVIKNNLVEVQLGIDSGTLEVTGTNQRIGLRGGLRALPGGRMHFQTNEFEVRQALIRFDDPTRVAPNVDITAVTEYRRYSDTSAGAAAGAGSGGGSSAASIGSTRGGSLWRITLHAYGDADDLRVDMTSEPALSQEDIVLLLTVGMTRAELDQLAASSIGASIALNALGAASGADRAVKQAIPIIDDFRFGSAYSTATGKTEPQLTVGKRLTNDLRASVTAGLSEDRELRSNIEWRLSNRLSVQGSYDNINDVSSSALGNLGMDLRWRLEFE